ACAGLSTPAPTAVNCTKVHPRVRGALTGVSRLLELCNGPSPRARGSQALVVGQFLGDRSIPACAGLSGQAGSVMFLEPVHPRVRGALTTPSSPSGGEGGPSPRARGSHPGDWPTLDDLRSIPACAGLSPSRTGTGPPDAVHPRVRGALRFPAERLLHARGPSPRARGSQPMTCHDAARYLPAMFSEATKCTDIR